jgi:hypothetical protein
MPSVPVLKFRPQIRQILVKGYRGAPGIETMRSPPLRNPPLAGFGSTPAASASSPTVTPAWSSAARNRSFAAMGTLYTSLDVPALSRLAVPTSLLPPLDCSLAMQLSARRSLSRVRQLKEVTIMQPGRGTSAGSATDPTPLTSPDTTSDDVTLNDLLREFWDRWDIARITGGYRDHTPIPRYGRTPGELAVAKAGPVDQARRRSCSG